MPGRLLWQKSLSATDAQKVSGNPTWCIKLSQAGFLHPTTRRKIDWITYFRNDAFVNLIWHSTGRIVDEEEADVLFDVSIDGKSFGVWKLKLIHKPSGEAYQSNVPTHLLWGDLEPLVSKSNFTKARLRLFAPEEGTLSPYFMEITTR